MSYQFKVTPHQDGRRIDALLRSLYPALPLGAMMKYFRKGQVRLNGKRTNFSTKVTAGSLIFVPWEPPEQVGRSKGADGKTHQLTLPVIYSDSMVLIVNKPSDLLSQPDKAGEDSVVTRALSLANDPDFLPQLCHRLDRNTSGIMVLATDGRALRELFEQFKQRQIIKHYLALVCGVPPEKGMIDAPLLKDTEKKVVRVDPSGLPAKTEYHRLDTNGSLSLLKVRLHSGRTHQIRAHLNHAGFPLVGDRKYGDFSRKKELAKLGAKRPMLHAFSLTFPQSKGLLQSLSGRSFYAPLADDFSKMLTKLQLTLPKEVSK